MIRDYYNIAMVYTNDMRKLLFSIFAHPDDEAFGPCGTLYKEAKTGTDVHLICVTDGEAGVNRDDHSDLGQVRLDEWQASGKLIGGVSIKALHYPDSKLCCDMYHQISDDIIKHVQETLGANSDMTEVDFLTFDRNGITGHPDHMIVSMITALVYNKFRQQPPANCRIGRLRYFCLDRTMQPQSNIDWLYMPAGRTQIDQIVELTDEEFEHKKAIMHAHHSQRGDMQQTLDRYGDHLRRENFWFEP